MYLPSASCPSERTAIAVFPAVSVAARKRSHQEGSTTTTVTLSRQSAVDSGFAPRSFELIYKEPHRERSTTTTVTLSREPRSTAARVSTVAAMRAAEWRLAPRCRARRRHRFASEHASCRQFVQRHVRIKLPACSAVDNGKQMACHSYDCALKLQLPDERS